MLESIELMLSKNNIFIHYLDSNYLLDLEDLNFPLRNIPADFNDFCVKAKGATLKNVDYELVVPDAVLQIMDEVENEQVPVLHAYKTRLNNHFSKFLPYLSSGIISPAELLEVVKQRSTLSPLFDTKTLKVLTKQLVKLDFIRATIRNEMPVVFEEEELSSGQVTQVEQWIEGKTDCDLINAIMHKLKETSMISMTSRSLAILYYSKVLKLPSFFGFQYFQTQLLEFDSSLNMSFWKQNAESVLDQQNLLLELDRRQNLLDPKQCFVEFWA
jgi:deoxyribodipyrimidine photolyase